MGKNYITNNIGTFVAVYLLKISLFVTNAPWKVNISGFKDALNKIVVKRPAIYSLVFTVVANVWEMGRSVTSKADVMQAGERSTITPTSFAYIVAVEMARAMSHYGFLSPYSAIIPMLAIFAVSSYMFTFYRFSIFLNLL